MSVLVVGAGISGLACARALQDAGVAVRVVERGRVAGGRMASKRFDGRPVDLGAAFFTASEGSPFARVVDSWVARGLARPWTDTVGVAGPEGLRESKSGPMRYAAARGLRSLVEDLAAGMSVEFGAEVPLAHSVEGLGTDVDTVVLAMPDPQARRLLPEGSTLRELLVAPSDWVPTISVVLGFDEPSWRAADLETRAVFVNDSDTLTFLADDGSRRGDGAPVLVAHSSAKVAREYLETPDAAITPVADAARRVLDISAPPSWSHAHRWTFARPVAQHPEPFALVDGIGVCGDAWGAPSSVGTAWASGDALGRAIAESRSER